jgi:hypothetical protein
MRYLCTAKGDVLEAIRRLESEARDYRRRGQSAAREEDRCVLEHKADKLEETAKYLRARLP